MCRVGRMRFGPYCSRFHFPSDKPQVCRLTPLICLVWPRPRKQSAPMAHNEAGTVTGSPRLITGSTVMALHCCENTMCHSASDAGRVWPAFEVSSRSQMPSRATSSDWVIDDAGQERLHTVKYRFKRWHERQEVVTPDRAAAQNAHCSSSWVESYLL